MNELSIYDYAVFIITLIIPLIVGFYYSFSGGRQSTVEEHMLADSKMTIMPVAFSLMASYMSAITMLGLPSEVMLFSTQFVVINFGYLIGTPIACYLILPVFYEKKYLSLFKYLEIRFNRKLRVLVSNLFTLEMVLYMGIVLYAPALALSAVTDLPKWTTIIVIGIVCTIYCVCGGIKAVLYNDIFQAGLMFIGLLLILFRGLSLVGGWSKMIETNWKNNRIQFFNMSLSPFERHTIWTQLIGGIFLHLSVFSINQTQIQRLLTLPTLKKSQLSLWIALPITISLSFITCITGLVMYAYFENCDPIISKKVSKPDQMVPYMMMKLFSDYPSLPGLIIASIFAGAISSVASFVNSLAVVTLEEVIRPILLEKHVTNNSSDNKLDEKKDNLSERNAVIYSKILAVFYGFLCLLIAYLCEKINRLLETCLALFGIAGGPMLAAFTLGISSRKCNANGAVFGFSLALFIGVLIGLGPIITNQRPTPLASSIDGCENRNQLINSTTTLFTPVDSSNSTNFFLYIFKISYMWICPITWLIATLSALIYSHFLPDKSLIVDENLLMPILRKKNAFLNLELKV